jgi:DNA-binding Xre family transcriptional regulator
MKSTDSTHDISANVLYKSNLDEILEQKNITKYKLAKETGITFATIYNFNERFGITNMKTIIRMCNFLKIDLNELIEKK